MASKSEVKYERFQWHMGVVEDRDDPVKLGRVKVRFFGVHPEDKSKVSTESLPWATVLSNASHGSRSGVGGPAVGIVPGTWVIGFFIDETAYQKPFIIGSFPGIPVAKADGTLGFNDPNEVFPKNKDLHGEEVNGLEEVDISRLARGLFAERHRSVIKRRALRLTDIPKAKAPTTDFEVLPEKDGVDYETVNWEEPHARNTDGKSVKDKEYVSKYPYNKVIESENGIIQEVDDTPGNNRIAYYHQASGSYQEIVHSGDRSTKITGNDYEIVVKDKNAYISGNCNVTIQGDAKVLVQGNKYEEIEGNYFLTVRKDKIEKIGGNHQTEILSDRATQINGNNYFTVGNKDVADTGHDVTSILGSETITVGKSHTETINGDVQFTFNANENKQLAGNLTELHKGNADIGIVGNYNLGVVGNYNEKTKANSSIIVEGARTETITLDVVQDYKANFTDTVGGNYTETITGTQGTTASVSNINNNVNITGTSTASVDHVSNGISGHGHTHDDTAGLGVGETSPPK